MTSKGHIYMIWSPLDNTFCYIGSTFNRLAKRWQGHKDNYKNKNGTLTIHKYFDKYGIENFKLDLIKSYDVVRTHKKDCKHLHAYELLWINKTKNCVNKMLPFNPLKKIENKIYKKKWQEENKDRIKKKALTHRLNNKEQRKEYDKNRQEEVKIRNKQKFECECGGKYTYAHKAEHFRSKKHKIFFTNSN